MTSQHHILDGGPNGAMAARSTMAGGLSMMAAGDAFGYTSTGRHVLELCHVIHKSLGCQLTSRGVTECVTGGHLRLSDH